MKIIDKANLFFPSKEAENYSKERRKKLRDYPNDFIKNLELESVAKLISPMNIEQLMTIMSEYTDDVNTLEYRLDCLDDFINVPALITTFRQLIRELGDSQFDVSYTNVSVNSFMKVKEKMDGLENFLKCIDNINEFFKKYSHAIKSKALKKLFAFFEDLPKDKQVAEIKANLSQLRDSFSKTIRSVKIGINFNSNMIPDSAGLLEIGYDKIYPKGNILEKIIFKSSHNSEHFCDEEHLNSETRNTPVDIDTALFRELNKYTKEFANKIANALQNYKNSIFTDLSELENQLDFYGCGAGFINSVKARGMNICRPTFLPAENRETKLKGVFDLSFYRQVVTKFPTENLESKIVTNDITLDKNAGFYIITGANNGGKTTFARAVAVSQVLAQSGFYVPCESAEVSPCDYVFTHFPKEEEVGFDSSRFSTEIKELKIISDLITDKSMVVLNESIQSTTPIECLTIAKEHLEIMAAVGVRGFYVTHLTGLYDELERINQMGYSTIASSLVCCTNNENGERLYKMKISKPPAESQAYIVYDKFGAKLSDVLNRQGGKK